MPAVRASLSLVPAVIIASGIACRIACGAKQVSPAIEAADLVLMDARVYTVDARHSTVEALAVRDGRVVLVGSNAEARRLVGSRTRVERLAGRLVLPGLVDAHIHALDIADLDVCNLENRPVPLKALAPFVAACVERYQGAPGTWLVVHQWNYAAGNQPDAQYPTLRAALDAASTRRPIQLLGTDGHHSAFNSPALERARDTEGEAVGLSKRTLAGPMAAYRALVGVDESGEPNGTANDDASNAINPGTMHYDDLDAVMKVPERIVERLRSAGITAILDAKASPEGNAVYDQLLARRLLTVHVTLAQFYDPSRTRRPDGEVDYESILSSAIATRAKYAQTPLVRADVIKIFADGGLEGNPLAVPPTLPNSPMLKPYLQPIFAMGAAGRAAVTGYVDTGSALCTDVRAHPEAYASNEQVSAFMSAHGYHPGQCLISSGRLQHDRAILLEYARRMHLAGFSLHIHSIGDRAVRAAIDAIEQARAADGNSSTRDALAHLQIAAPGDVARIGHDRLFVAFTYAWMSTEPEYDLTVIPFIDKVRGNGYRALHHAGNYYEANAYPVRAVRDAGAILVAGSDAPVDTADPRPFVNMSRAVTRRLPGLPALAPEQSIPLRDVIDAYTINGARMLGLEEEAGSLEVGKSADFIVLDRDILALADAGLPDAVANAQVLETWFQGRQVYQRSAHSSGNSRM